MRKKKILVMDETVDTILAYLESNLKTTIGNRKIVVFDITHRRYPLFFHQEIEWMKASIPSVAGGYSGGISPNSRRKRVSRRPKNLFFFRQTNYTHCKRYKPADCDSCSLALASSILLCSVSTNFKSSSYKKNKLRKIHWHFKLVLNHTTSFHPTRVILLSRLTGLISSGFTARKLRILC